MCKFKITICKMCETEINTEFALCGEGRAGLVCSGPATPSGRPFLRIARRRMGKGESVDMRSIAPSFTYDVVCEPCSRL